MTTEVILLKINTTSIPCEVYVNNIPVTHLQKGDASDGVDIPINQYLVKGENHFHIIIHVGVEPGYVMEDWSKHPLAKDYTGDASMTIHCVGRDTGHTYFNMNWQGALVPTPAVLTKQYQFLPPYSTDWLWRKAVPLEPKDIELGYHYLQSLHALIMNGSVKGFVDASYLKFKEHSIAYGIGMKGMEKSMVSVINARRGSDEYEMLPISKSLLQSRLIANNRMLEFRRPDWGHALQFINKRHSQAVFYLPISIGKVDGEWMILQ